MESVSEVGGDGGRGGGCDETLLRDLAAREMAKRIICDKVNGGGGSMSIFVNFVISLLSVSKMLCRLYPIIKLLKYLFSKFDDNLLKHRK